MPITAKVVADMLGSAGINRVLTVDLHADQIQGFLRFPLITFMGRRFYCLISKDRIIRTL